MNSQQKHHTVVVKGFFLEVSNHTSVHITCRNHAVLAALQNFAQRQVRDTAQEVPADYAPPDFTTAALQHTNVKLTWDADDDSRKKALRKKMTEDSIRNDDFKVSTVVA